MITAEQAQKVVLEVGLSYVPVVNLALQQNALPVVSELNLKNQLEHDLVDLQCEFSANPPIILPSTLTIKELRRGEEVAIPQPELELDYTFLSTLSEAVKGKLRLLVHSGGKELVRAEYELEAFAADQWLGLDVMPELLASFVTPNLEVIRQLQPVIAEELRRATGSPSIQGYQDGKNRAYEICAAIYRAIHGWGIHYANPASSFGSPGQRIRFADAIYQYHLGTCLDTALLFASVMELCGLHPVIMLQSGHAYVGCHLVDRYFSDVPVDDLQSIRKLAAMDEFLVIETTMVTGKATFSEAEAAARAEHLNVDGDFHCAVDVVRARYSGIRPLPLTRSVNGVVLAPPETAGEVEALGEERKRRLQHEIDLSRLSQESGRTGRVARWSQKLLDLSLRNRLLNVRDTVQVIPIACSDITVLEDKIAAEEALSLNPLANLLGEKDLHDLSMLRTSEVSNEIKFLLDRELEQKRLWAPLPPRELARRLIGLYRQSRTDLEEGGVNTLFLAVGFLEWRESEREEKSCLAPILLIPIRFQRKSMAEGIRIVRLDEETVINETLLELLRSRFQLTIPGLTPLPTDASGVDVNLVLQIFQQTIRELKGWEVREEARIGRFSFNKFVMWNDLTARSEILNRHPLIHHLMMGGGLFDDGIETFPAAEVGRHLNLQELYCPLSADSSQLAAVLYSQLGKSFVLHGPPGTGKSQTIANLIAHNLAWGRRVLFVSEKRAALEVVHRRLTALGLRPFCLELHSSKSGKNEVLAQFSEALKVVDSGPPGDWESVARAMSQLRDELNEYVSELHAGFPNGLSAYDCLARMLDSESALPEGLLKADLLGQTREELEGFRRLASDLANAWSQTSPEALSALQSLAPMNWSPALEKTLLAVAGELITAAEKLQTAFQEQARELAIPETGELTRIYATARLVEQLKTCDGIPAALFADDLESRIEFLHQFAANAEQEKRLAEALSSYHLERLLELDFDGIAARIQNYRKTFFLIRFFQSRVLLRELSPVKKLGGTPLTVAELDGKLAEFKAYVQSRRQVENSRERAAELLGNCWRNGDPDWTALDEVFNRARQLLEPVRNLAERDETLKKALIARLREWLPEAGSRFGRSSPRRIRINEFLQTWNGCQEKLQAFAAYVPKLQADSRLADWVRMARELVVRAGELRGVLRYRKLRDAASAQGLGDFATALESGVLGSSGITETFDRIYCTEMLNQILAHSPTLSNFVGANQNARILRFRELDRQYTELARRIVFAKLAAALPRRRSGPCPEGTELGLLKRECEKRARQKPVRQLLEQIPTLAPILKPCFLMSPLSVAQYLPADSAPFDLIVFDEASQIPVWDAIGVIARGRQLIVVGDPRQMPPTNFFQKGDSGEEDLPPEAVEDPESILDECLAAGLPATCLNWHYRSRHESLIAFSNHYYYEDRLFTFPAACGSERFGVRLEWVADGIYDRKATRTNPREAERLVHYVFERLADPTERGRSIGIVTFSLAQQELIEDLVERERSRHPQLEEIFNEQNREPLFVKNLENVQGDERDVILFSIGYAPDAEGKFSMNFGPLNRQGGERRLNVAITRAREQVVVFSSIHATQIDLSRTTATGAAHLKYFLEYAEKGLHIRSEQTETGAVDGVIEAIAGMLTAHGFSVERGVGSSAGRIDLAVRNPDHPADYLLGIIGDGALYAAQKTTRDRDSLREAILRSLGWNLYRAWSVDWVLDRNRAEQSLLAHLEELRSAPVPETSGGPETTPEPPPASTGAEPPAVPVVRVPEHRLEYRWWAPSGQLPQYLFYEHSSLAGIRNQMIQVVQQEGPICESLLKRRLVKAWGFNRTGENIQKILAEALPTTLVVTWRGEERVFWPDGVTPENYRDYRVPVDAAGKRSIDEIPPEELANAMFEVLVDFSSCEQDTLYRETVKLFGLSVVTAKARKYLDWGLKVLRESGRI